jgi:CRP/FNR family transcriptional regulator
MKFERNYKKRYMNKEFNFKVFPFWDSLSIDEKNSVMSAATAKKYDKDQYIYGFSDACLGMIYVKKGGIRVFTTSNDGREITFFHIEEGDCCILSASCVIGQLSVEVELTADDDTELLAIHSGVFGTLVEKNVNVRCWSFQLSTKRLSSIVWVMQQILFLHFDERLATYLLSVYEKTGERKIKMTQEYMAQEVNSAREVVARMLKQFASDKLIEINRGAITIIDVEGLRNVIKNS